MSVFHCFGIITFISAQICKHNKRSVVTNLPQTACAIRTMPRITQAPASISPLKILIYNILFSLFGKRQQL